MSLQRDVAKNGTPIFKIDGRSVVSSFDPIKEANGWAANALKEIGERDTVIILGAGCGYHIKALRDLRHDLSVLTIEADTEIAEFAREVLSANNEIDPRVYGEIVHAPSAIHLTENLILRDFMSRRYAVVTHAGLAQMRPEWTESIARFLIGRDALSFLLQLRMRPELHALFDESKIAQLQNQTGPISILTIRSLFNEQSLSTRERRLWRVLEELIV